MISFNGIFHKSKFFWPFSSLTRQYFFFCLISFRCKFVDFIVAFVINWKITLINNLLFTALNNKYLINLWLIRKERVTFIILLERLLNKKKMFQNYESKLEDARLSSIKFSTFGLSFIHLFFCFSFDSAQITSWLRQMKINYLFMKFLLKIYGIFFFRWYLILYI